MGSKKKKGVPPEEEPVMETEATPEETEREEAAQEAEPAPGETAEAAPGEDEEKGQLKDQLMRTLAEYDNFRKRSAKEKETLFADGKAYAVEALLTVADKIGRASCRERVYRLV